MADDPISNRLPPVLRACSLFERTSETGTYLAGRWGDLRVVIVRVRSALPNGPTHKLMFSEAVSAREGQEGEP
jgi:hypothetical protein